MTLAVVALPILFAAAIVRIDTPGNPFFLQERVGRGGRIFRLVKLRGMYVDAKARFPHLYDLEACSGSHPLDFHFHQANDPRVTRVGKFLRRASIDELPNLVNVLRGDMALVGPRPQIPEIFKLYGDRERAYVAVRPGITCFSKCAQRDSLTEAQILDADLGYMRRATFLNDWKIIFRTFIMVVTCRDVV